jgi:hypothetical protein
VEEGGAEGSGEPGASSLAAITAVTTANSAYGQRAASMENREKCAVKSMPMMGT